MPFDERAALVSRAETLSVPFSTAYNYAHAFKIDSLAPDTGTEVNGQVVVPVRSRRPPKPCQVRNCGLTWWILRAQGIVPLSIACFDPAGAYLIENGMRTYVWLGAHARCRLLLHHGV